MADHSIRSFLPDSDESRQKPSKDYPKLCQNITLSTDDHWSIVHDSCYQIRRDIYIYFSRNRHVRLNGQMIWD